MNNLTKPIIIGAVIIAIAIFLGAQRIAYVLSLDGKVASCEKIYSDNATYIGLPRPTAVLATRLCVGKYILGTGNAPD